MKAQLALDLDYPGWDGRLVTMIARVKPSLTFKELYEWKRLQDHGWDVTALRAPDGRSVVLLACRGQA